jgi:acyl carrier protein
MTATLDLVRRHLDPWLDPSLDRAHVVPTARLREDLNLSSLDAVSLVMAVEDELGIEVGDDELKDLRTIDDLVRLLESKSGGGA